jgi:poly-gamma-glutamate capsule biosynthesis protein CapA/YwtB (metallophosphatase superfamily)
MVNLKLTQLLAVFALFFLAVACSKSRDGQSSADQKDIAVSGKVLDEEGRGIKSARVKIIGAGEIPVPTGDFSTSVAFQRVYQIQFSAPGYYTMHHSFSDVDMLNLRGIIPPVILVEKIPGRALLAFAGDVMMGRRYLEPLPGEPQFVRESQKLNDAKILVGPIKPYLEVADYTSVNLATPVIGHEPPKKSNKPITFFSPPEVLDALQWAGVDHVSLGNDHSHDYLHYGLEQTLIYLNEKRIGYSGAGLYETEALQAHRASVGETAYSFLGYVGAKGDSKPNQVAEGDTSGAALGSEENIVNSVQQLRSGRAVVVAYHAGGDFSDSPTQQTRERLKAAIDAGADIAVAHHRHVLQGFEIYKNKLIAYSLGDFLFDQDIYPQQRSALLYVWMDGQTFHRAEVVPLYIKAYRPTPAMGDLRTSVLNRLERLSASEGVTIGLSGGHGAIVPHTNTARVGLSVRRQFLLGIDVIKNSEGLQKINWHETVDMSKGKPLAMGHDAWSLGNFEQHEKLGVSVSNWHFSETASSIGHFDDMAGFNMQLVKPAGKDKTTATQKYFTQVWVNSAQSVVVNVYASHDTHIQLCLELLTNTMLTRDARKTPEIKCLKQQSVKAGGWHQLTFDVDYPLEAEYRGERIQLNMLGEKAQRQFAHFDDLRFIIWD